MRGLDKVKKWFHPDEGALGGWDKDLPTNERRELALASANGDYLLAAQRLQALSNVNSGRYGDRKTHSKAYADANYFFGMHNRYPNGEEGSKSWKETRNTNGSIVRSWKTNS